MIGQIFASGKRVVHFNAFTGGDTLRISRQTLALQKLELLSYLMLKTARSYLHLSRENTGMLQTDRPTHGQNRCGYYSGVHCELHLCSQSYDGRQHHARTASSDVTQPLANEANTYYITEKQRACQMNAQ